MDPLTRLSLLSSQMGLEPAEEAACPKLSERRPAPKIDDRKSPDKLYLSPAVLPNGKRITLLKSLLTSACERNCYYCPFRAGRDMRRLTFKPEEFARTFMNVYNGGVAQGIFLSSGIVGGGMRTQDKLIDTAEILRRKLGYRGYIHLKVMPGAERDQVLRAMQLADRVSVNLEAPNSLRLERLAPGKQFTQELVQPLHWVEHFRRSLPAHLGWNGRWPSSVTQFVVGGAGESDLELVSVSQQLYRQARIGRAYYSAFSPVPDTPLENLPAESPLREHRLYQASFLLRDYGFDTEELPFDDRGFLPLDTDPKLAWARQNLEGQPLDVNIARREDLLRIPGIGPKSAQAIINARRHRSLNDLPQLRKLGINVDRLAPFILLNGKRPAYQHTFW